MRKMNKTPDVAYLALGQSNMAFRGRYGEEPDGTSPVSIMFMNNAITDSDKGEILSETVPWDWRYSIETDYFRDKFYAGEGRGNDYPAGLSPQHSFAVEMQSYHGGCVGMIDSAIGGESIESYRPGNELYRVSLKRTLKAKEDGIEIKGIIWHQGERNCMDSPEIANNYAKILSEIVSAFRTDLDIPNLPIVVGEVGRFFGEKENIYGFEHPYYYIIQEQINLAPKIITNCIAVSSFGLTSRGDNLHFSSQAYEELGKRYAVAMRELLDK